MAAADTARLIAQLVLDDRQFQAALQRSSKSIGRLESRMGRIGSQAQRGLSNAAANIEKGVALGAGAAVAGLAASVKVASDFEAQLNTINTVARATPAELSKIGDGIRQIARDTGTPLEELTQGFYDLVSAGVAANQAQLVLASSNKLAIGGLASAAEGVDLLTTALNSYGVSAQNQGKESQRFADIFAKSIERGKVTAGELAASFAQVGGIAANNGIEIEELAASYAQLTAKGVPAAEAATNIRSALLALIRRTGDLEKLEKATGKSYLAIASKQGLVNALEQLRIDADKAGVPMIDLLGRVEGLNFAVSTTGSNLASYNANLEAMGSATGTAAAQMSERQKGLNAQLSRLGANVKDAAITIGSALIPELLTLSTELTGVIQGNQGNIQKFAKDLANGIRDAVKWAKSLDWNLISNSLKTAGQGARAVVDAFVAMPTWVQGAVLTGWGLNKLTGGALGSIVGELGKGLIKGVLGMNAGVVHINAGTVTGVGGGVPGVAGAAGKGLGAVSKMFLVGEAIGLALLVNEVRTGLGDQATAQGKAITDATTKFVTENNLTREQLVNSLAAVDKGIADIKSNPLNVLVQGDALDELQKSREILAKQLAVTGQTGGASPDERQEAQTRFNRGISPDAGDSKELPKITANTGEMRTEFIADRKAAEIAAARIGEMRTEFNLARGENLTASLNSTNRLDSLRQLTANVQTGVVAAVNNMSANVTAAIANIRLVPPTINVPRPPTPVVNVNISNRAVNTAVSRNTTFTRPL